MSKMVIVDLRIFRPLFLFFFAISLRISIAQPVAPSPAADVCNGIFLSYQYTTGKIIPPHLATGSPSQPYKFESTLTILNNGLVDLKSWQVFVGFQHDEYLVSASNAVLADGTTIPTSVGNGTVFAGYPSTDLLTAIETAGDMNQIQVVVDLVGTQFGVASPSVPMPSNISLVNTGFSCPKPTMSGLGVMNVCCIQDPNSKTNVTSAEEFLPRQTGDLVITYDVTRTYVSSYLAQVTISNHNPLGHLDYWMLSWDWMRNEFIGSMKGAYPTVVDTSECVFGPQGNYYQDLDFSTMLNCETRPTIVDLPLSYTNDSNLGMIPHCCRNGTILPSTMNPSESISAFQMQVYKMPPDLNRTKLYPPQNWMINGTFSANYKCGPPVRVSPSEFLGYPSNTTAFASWQVVCNITRPKGSKPRCCVSFSAYNNDSVIPCNTCACGCQSNPSNTCSTTTPALLLPSEALLVPFAYRTNLSTAWYKIKHQKTVPLPYPCGDNCGVSINWHLFTDYTTGWSARITLFNWGETEFANWFAAVELDNATPGFQKMYSFNATVMNGTTINNTIFMQGLEGLNYLVAEDNSKTTPVPGKQQSVISFTKKHIPALALGDKFPSKVYFNGEECVLPTILPISKGNRIVADSSISSFLLAALVLIFVQQWLL